MNSIELILRLIEVKASHYWGSSFTYAQTYPEENYRGTPSAFAREEIYDAKCEALREIVEEIRRGLPDAASESRTSHEKSPDRRFVFITEMAGTMTASVKNTYPELQDARDRFDRDHEDYFEDNSNCKSAWEHVVINPRRNIPRQEALSTGVLDVRLVLIMDVDGDLDAVICDTEAELQRQIAAFEDEYRERIKRQDAVWSSHEIVIPPRPEAAS